MSVVESSRRSVVSRVGVGKIVRGVIGIIRQRSGDANCFAASRRLSRINCSRSSHQGRTHAKRHVSRGTGPSLEHRSFVHEQHRTRGPKSGNCFNPPCRASNGHDRNRPVCPGKLVGGHSIPCTRSLGLCQPGIHALLCHPSPASLKSAQLVCSW